MPDQITTPKRLEQIRWHKGITDNDIREGYMERLDNVEIDRPGQIRSRDGLSWSDLYNPTSGQHVVKKYSGNPSGDSAGGWLVWLDTANVHVVPFGATAGDTRIATMQIPASITSIDLDTVDMLFVGSNIYIVSDDTSGDANDIFVISWAGKSKRFKSPEWLTDSYSCFSTEDYDGRWVSFALNQSPNVQVFANNRTDGHKSSRSSMISNASNWVSVDPLFRVGLYIEPHREAIENPREVISTSGDLILQFLCVFEFYDGTLSGTSNEITYTVKSGDLDGGLFDVGLSLIVDEGISETVSAIRVYRKVLDATITGGNEPVTSGDYDLLFTANMYTTVFDEDTGFIPLFNGNAYTDPIGPLTDTIETERIEEDFGLKIYNRDASPGPGIGWFHPTEVRASGTVYVEYTHKITEAGELSTYKTSDGWMKPFEASLARLYLPPHFYRTGDTVTSKAENLGGGHTGIDVYEPTQTVSIVRSDPIHLCDRRSIIEYQEASYNQQVYDGLPCCIKGSLVIDFFKVYDSANLGGFVSPGGNANAATANELAPFGEYTYDLQFGRGFYDIGADLGSGYTWNGTPTLDLYKTVAKGQEGVERCFVLYRDQLEIPQNPTLTDEFGVNPTANGFTPKPKALGSAGGRLFAVNYSDGSRQFPATLSYSEFLKPSIFKNSNKIDYGARDDGIGVAILTYGSNIVVLHDSSTYIFDIAGGSDLTWREIGSFSNIGCIDKKLALSTQYGLFWCDRMHMYWLAGSSPRPITLEIQDRYKEMLNGAYSMTYREDLKQIWLTKNENALIFDIASQAWHEHQFTDSVYGNIEQVYTAQQDQYLLVTDDNRDNTRHYKLEEVNYNAEFDWGFSTGSYDFGVPEIVKKIKRLYMHLVEANGSTLEKIELSGSGTNGGDITIQDDFVIGEQSRFSLSVKGFAVTISMYVRKSISEGSFWKGRIESLGVSYKSKNIK